jgi:LSD1 subclass zinc finger protein
MAGGGPVGASTTIRVTPTVFTRFASTIRCAACFTVPGFTLIPIYSNTVLPHYRITALPHYQIRNTKPCAACRNPEAYEISAAHCAPDARSRSKIPEPDVKANRHA